MAKGSDVPRLRVLEARKAAGLTQREAAERAGMHPVFWSDIERGRTPNPTLRTACRMAGALGVTLDSLLEEKET